MYRLFPLPYLNNSAPYFERIRHLPLPVYLDSGKPSGRYGRYDIISAGPEASLSFRDGKSTLKQHGKNTEVKGNPFQHLGQLFDQFKDRCPMPSQKDVAELPFCGGLLGFFSYDLGRSLEHLPELNTPEIGLPDLHTGIYGWAVIVDHLKQKTTLVTSPVISAERNSELQQILTEACSQAEAPAQCFKLTSRFSSNMSEAEYYESLDRVSDYIQAGDCYQVNFAQRFNAAFTGDPWQGYQMLREHAPTPYSAFIETEHGAILSHSPEQFLEVDEGKVTTKPIQGTRPRGDNPATDAQLKLALQDSEKDRSENLMIVDLMRNDISKVCQLGSVRVPKLFAVESYANVHHLVSTITGQLDNDKTPIDLLEHCFPGGSITGAPKIRAMEIIEELEPNRRSVYCGSIGYLSFSGKMDTSITIRTLVCQNNQIYCWAGGGIVADSETADEYQETYNKVNNLLRPLEKTFTSS